MIWIGAAIDQVPGPRHFEALSLAEICLHRPLPRPATLKRLRHERSSNGTLALRVAPSLLRPDGGPLEAGPALSEALAWVVKASDALAAKAVVVPTPPQLTPGARGRELLARIAEELRDGLHGTDGGPVLVWEPHGPWDPEQTAELAARLSLVCAFDPLHDARPPGIAAYARIQALGEHSSLSDAGLERALEPMLAGEGPRFIVIEGPRAMRQARRMVELSTGHDTTA